MNTLPGSVVAVMAHPDDAELWAGGTLALHARSSDVTIVVASSDPERRAEAVDGARLLGANLRLLDRHSVDMCKQLLNELRPEVVIMHRLDDVHPDHQYAAQVVLGAIPDVVIASGYPQRLYTCDSYESLTVSGRVEGRVIVDISETFQLKKAALAAHRSQPLDHFLAMAERIGAAWGGKIGRPWAEAFDPVPILGRLPSATHL